ncbi:hypothetical protein [Streptomyces sp. NPDC005336]|uniref:hypothetical protein n=1 Tax=Streptomyces sp. NPDC005336 TaxID=3157035 RepID=UPI0033B94684
MLQELTQEFLRLRAMESRQQAGREFEPFLHRLFTLFDLEPTLAYNLKGEQIDGAIYYNTDHFVVEAKWLADTVEAEDLGRVRLDELISRKLLHASTTGNCYYPATEMLG